MTTLIYTHDDCLEHRPGPHHPESPERLRAVLAALEAPEFARARWREAPLGTREQVLLVHTPDYVASVEAMAPMEGYQLLDAGDTIMSPGTLQAVMRCVGAACAAVDAVIAKEASNAFCATRPCGHHAEADRAMGFCVYNQAAIAALHARHAHGLQRIAVVDFDVHHGNGTQHAFWGDPQLFYGSSHQSPFYPGTGARYESGVAHNIVNVPLSIISAGIDAHFKDPLGGLSLTDDDFHWITTELMKVADATAGGRVVSILEGGYSLQALASATAAHVRALMQD